MIKKITFILITFILFQSSYANQCSYNDIEVEIKRREIKRWEKENENINTVIDLIYKTLQVKPRVAKLKKRLEAVEVRPEEYRTILEEIAPGAETELEEISHLESVFDDLLRKNNDQQFSNKIVSTTIFGAVFGSVYLLHYFSYHNPIVRAFRNTRDKLLNQELTDEERESENKEDRKEHKKTISRVGLSAVFAALTAGVNYFVTDYYLTKTEENIVEGLKEVAILLDGLAPKNGETLEDLYKEIENIEAYTEIIAENNENDLIYSLHAIVRLEEILGENEIKTLRVQRQIEYCY